MALAIPLTVMSSSTAFAETADWAEWESLSGSGGNYTTTMQLPAGGFPAASVTSNSRAGSVGVISGASTWLSEATPPGEIYGSSRNKPYLNLRPKADRAGVPSVTTYTFEHPTPATGWAFVLGDIDADQVTVSAKGPDGQELDVADLGFQDVFNYCDADASPSCTGGDLPTWDPATATLTGNDTATDTNGASGWFQPTASIKSLTFEFEWRAGFPVYQAWFASLARDIAGTVTGPDVESVTGSTLTLYGPDGTELATTNPAEDGSYSFPGYTASDGYSVEITPPSGYLMDESAGEAGQRERPADLGDEDDLDVDFALRAIVPVEVSGHVFDEDGNPLRNVEVTLTDGQTYTTTTDSNGFYVFDEVQPDDYTFDVTPPDGYAVISEPQDITVPPDSEDPLRDNDFVLGQLPSLSGSVTAGGDPVSNVTVEITGPGGFSASTTTDAEGNYSFDGLEPGDYTVTIVVPEGYQVDGEDELSATVDDADVTDVDFELFRPGSLGGMVVDDAGDPVPGVTIEVTGPDGPVTLTTDDEGNYYLDDLPPGEYNVVITAPDGFTVDGEDEYTITITEAGESELDLDFRVVPEDTGGDETGGDETGGDETGGDETGGDESGTDSGDDGGAADGSDESGADEGGADEGGAENGGGGDLPDTGAADLPLIGIGLLLLFGGAIAVTLSARRTSSPSSR